VFYVSQLKKCLRVPEEQIPLKELSASEDLSYQECSVRCAGVDLSHPKFQFFECD
jgi:hypothetical protein